ncbi:MAG: hypothetical protein RL708_152 [Bacteroidota bacterium]|jgi:nucleotide-binding universal stress UspA family protein
MKSQQNKKILIALDYNPTAQKVAEVGYQLAKAIGANVTLIHVVIEPVYYTNTDYSPIMGFNGYLDAGLYQFDDLKKISQQYLKQSKKHLNDDSIEMLLGEGDAADFILTTANKLQSDIIVMGSHSRQWLEDILLGSVTKKVLRHSNIPLFIVPTKKGK